MNLQGEILCIRLTSYHILECPVIVQEVIVRESSNDAETHRVDIPNAAEFRQRKGDKQLQNSPFRPDQRRLERTIDRSIIMRN